MKLERMKDRGNVVCGKKGGHTDRQMDCVTMTKVAEYLSCCMQLKLNSHSLGEFPMFTKFSFLHWIGYGVSQIEVWCTNVPCPIICLCERWTVFIRNLLTLSYHGMHCISPTVLHCFMQLVRKWHIIVDGEVW